MQNDSRPPLPLYTYLARFKEMLKIGQSHHPGKRRASYGLTGNWTEPYAAGLPLSEHGYGLRASDSLALSSNPQASSINSGLVFPPKTSLSRLKVSTSASATQHSAHIAVRLCDAIPLIPMRLGQKHSPEALEKNRKHGSSSAHKGKAARAAVLRVKAEQRAIWRDPVLAAQALAELAASSKPRRGRPPKGTSGKLALPE